MASPFLDHKLNRMPQGTARLVIGQIPVSYDVDAKDAPPEESINALITGYTIPGSELEYATHAHYNGVVHIPVSEQNAYRGKVLVVNMISDDRQENYWTLWRYMETIRSGRMGGVPIEEVKHRIFGNDKEYRNRLMYIPRIDIVFADGSMQRHQRIIFHRCFPMVLSEIQMNFNDPSPVTFTASFVFSNHTIERYDAPNETSDPMDVLD